MSKAFILVLIAEFWMTLGQIYFKKGADRLNINGTDQRSWIFKLLEGILNLPVLWIGAGTMVIGMLFWFAALNSGDLNYVYLLGSIQYIFALFAAHFFLQERINTTKLIGTLLITLGIILTAIS